MFLRTRAAPNIALHLTASSVRSCVGLPLPCFFHCKVIARFSCPSLAEASGTWHGVSLRENQQIPDSKTSRSLIVKVTFQALTYLAQRGERP